MAREDMPFDEDAMTLIMGIHGPDEPGQHGRTEVPPPNADAIGLLVKISDMINNFLIVSGKNPDDNDSESSEKDKKEDKENEDNEF